MHRRRLPLKWSIENNKKKTREQSAMGKTKTSPRQDTADVGHDPAAEERATESVADSMNATPNSSNQGNKKKKTKNESPATTAKADSVQNLRGNGSKQVTVGKPAEISHDRMTQESSASSTNKNEILATSTKDSDKGPDAVKGADESVATNMNAARNSSSQGDDKKKREKELAAAAARDVRDARNECVAAIVDLQRKLKGEVPEGLEEEEVTVTAFTDKDRQAGFRRTAEALVELKEIQAELNKSSEKNSEEKRTHPAVATQESLASSPAAESKDNCTEAGQSTGETRSNISGQGNTTRKSATVSTQCCQIANVTQCFSQTVCLLT